MPTIELFFNAASESRVRTLWDEFASFGSAFMRDSGARPHITLVACEPVDVAAASELLDRFATSTVIRGLAFIIAGDSLQLRRIWCLGVIRENNMKAFLIWICILLSFVRCKAESDENASLWIVVSRSSSSKITYSIRGEALTWDKCLDRLMKHIQEYRERASVNAIFEHNCTFNEYANLRGWLGKIGFIHEKYFLADTNHRAIVEFTMIGMQQAFPAAAVGAHRDDGRPSPESR
ncbi:MAG TPA: hypothetical protein VIT91_06320 [Chthoniobacterales bacterium]